MYKSLWNLIHNHVKEAHVTPVFLVASTVGWTIIGLLPGCIGYLMAGNAAFITKLTILFCATGYATVIPGFLGGIFFLYRVSLHRVSHPKSSSVKIPQQRKSCQYQNVLPLTFPDITCKNFYKLLLRRFFQFKNASVFMGFFFLDKNRIITKVSISDARNDSHTPFIPISTESTTAQITIATAPLIRDPMIAGRAFPVAEK